jgi:hypothetical protein
MNHTPRSAPARPEPFTYSPADRLPWKPSPVPAILLLIAVIIVMAAIGIIGSPFWWFAVTSCR